MRGAAVLLVALVVGFPATARESEALRVVVPELPAQLDPHKAVTAADLAVARDVFVGLVARDGEGQLIPGAASWEIAPDGLSYTFALRPGLVWSDGKEMEAEDFVAGLARAVAPDTAAPFAADLFALQGAEEINTRAPAAIPFGAVAADGHTLRLTLKRRSARLLEVLSRPIAAPIPRHRLAQLGEGWVAPQNIVGNGAYRIDAAAPTLSLIKNPRYFDASAVETDRIEFQAAATADEALERVRDGDAHLTFGFSLEGNASSGRSLRAEVGQDLLFVAVNARRKPLDKREFRHALAMTIDREGILKALRPNLATPAYTMVPPGLVAVGAHKAAYAGLTPNYRSAIAEVLLAESNIDAAHPVSLTLSYARGAAAAAIAKSIAASWAKIGILLRLEERSEGDHNRSLRAGEFDFALATWADHEAPGGFAFLTPLGSGAGPRNFPGYHEPELDQRLIDADADIDAAHLPIALADAEGVVIEDQIILPIFFFTPLRALRGGVDAWKANASGIHPLHLLSP